MRVLVDTNILLDYYMEREPFLEDALQVECAKSCCADYIITRNVADYKSSAVPAILPSDFLELKI